MCSSAWLDVMHIRLKFLIVWPERDILRHNLPSSFKQHYPSCVCTIDCSEIFIDTPVQPVLKQEPKLILITKNNSIKFLTGITPNSSISFLSRCWGGQVSDKHLISNTSFYKHLLPGDVVLADRGFTITDNMLIHGAKLEFHKRKKKTLKMKWRHHSNFLGLEYM